MFPPIEYLEWIRGRPEAADHDLGSSDLRVATSTPTPGPVPERLEGRTPPDDDRSLEEQLAAVYEVPPSRVLVTAGATHANFLAMAATLDGGTALVERPGYEPFVATPRALGATARRFERPPETGHRLDPDRIGERCDRGTQLVVVSNRHNPTGRHTPRDRLRRVADAVEAAGAELLVDEVYAPYRRPGADAIGFGGGSAVDLPSTVVTGSLTKFFGLGGLRIGWLIAEPDVIERARRAAAHVPAVATPSRALARRALHHRADIAAEARERIETNSATLRRFVESHDALAGSVRPGCSYAFITHEHADGDALTEAAWERGVLVVPGRFFDAPEGVRVSAARDPDAVETGLGRLDAALATL